MVLTVSREELDRTIVFNQARFSPTFAPYNLGILIGDDQNDIYRLRDACNDLGMVCSNPRDTGLSASMFGAFEKDSGMLVRGTGGVDGPVRLSVVGNLYLGTGADLLHDVLTKGTISAADIYGGLDGSQEMTLTRAIWEDTAIRIAKSAERNSVNPSLLLKASNFQDFLSLVGVQKETAIGIVRQRYDVPSQALEQIY